MYSITTKTWKWCHNNDIETSFYKCILDIAHFCLQMFYKKLAYLSTYLQQNLGLNLVTIIIIYRFFLWTHVWNLELTGQNSKFSKVQTRTDEKCLGRNCAILWQSSETSRNVKYIASFRKHLLWILIRRCWRQPDTCLINTHMQSQRNVRLLVHVG